MPKCTFCNDTRRFRMPRWHHVTETAPQEHETPQLERLPDWEFDCPNCSSFGYSEIEPVYAREVIPAIKLNYSRAPEEVIESIQAHLARNMAMYLLREGFMRKRVDGDEPYRDQDEVLIELRLGVVNPGKLRKVEARDNEIRQACIEDFAQDIKRMVRETAAVGGYLSKVDVHQIIEEVERRVLTQLEQDNAQAEQIDRRDAAAPTGHE